MQAAPRQSVRLPLAGCDPDGCTPCRQRRGKVYQERMLRLECLDAPRAGSAEAKWGNLGDNLNPLGCTPCRQRRGKEALHPDAYIRRARCTPCRQRRGKAPRGKPCKGRSRDAPRAGSAEAKVNLARQHAHADGCTPCRQRRGKVTYKNYFNRTHRMHPVQAAPRQR